MNHDNKKFWQRFAKLYGPIMNMSSKALYVSLCEEICRHLQPDWHVLELACGTGQLTLPLYRHVKVWEATDFSDAMLQETKAKVPQSNQLHFSLQDATNLTYRAEQFDAIVIANAFHIMPEPGKALQEIHRVLKPDGILFAPTFVHSEYAGFRLRVKLMELAGFHVFHNWTAGQLSDFVTQHHFKVQEQKLLGAGIAPMSYVMAKKIT